MAPSRAALPVRFFFFRLRSSSFISSRSLHSSTSCGYTTWSPAHVSPTLWLSPRQPRHPLVSPSRLPSPRSAVRRTYAADASTAAEHVGSTTQAGQAGPAPPDYLNERERAVFDRLNAELEPVELEVQDISGGCGSMYAVAITSARFRGLPVIRQHRLVNQVLADQIKDWHGIQLKTRVP